MSYGNKLDLCINQGATFTQQLTIKASNGANIANIGTAELRSQLRTSYEAVAPTASFSFTWVDHSNGIANMTMAATVTAGIPAGSNYVYDVELYFLDGTVYRVLQGKAKVSPEVTK
jgi:hypothetical protein